MKAELNETGKLSVMAETPLESFALNQWFAMYSSTDEKRNGAIILSIETKVQDDD